MDGEVRDQHAGVFVPPLCGFQGSHLYQAAVYPLSHLAQMHALFLLVLASSMYVLPPAIFHFSLLIAMET